MQQTYFIIFTVIFLLTSKQLNGNQKNAPPTLSNLIINAKEEAYEALEAFLVAGGSANAFCANIVSKKTSNYIGNKNYHLLHGAALGKSEELIQLLCKHNARLNTKDYEGKTPLILATEQSNFAAMQALILEHRRRGVSLEAASNNGETAFLYAA